MVDGSAATVIGLMIMGAVISVPVTKSIVPLVTVVSGIGAAAYVVRGMAAYLDNKTGRSHFRLQ